MVHVGVNQFTHFGAGSTAPAGVVGLTVFTIDKRGKCPGQCNARPSGRAVKKLRVRYVVIFYRTNQRALSFVVTEYILKKQNGSNWMLAAKLKNVGLLWANSTTFISDYRSQ